MTIHYGNLKSRQSFQHQWREIPSAWVTALIHHFLRRVHATIFVYRGGDVMRIMGLRRRQSRFFDERIAVLHAFCLLSDLQTQF